jgi:hypothetical protein
MKKIEYQDKEVKKNYELINSIQPCLGRAIMIVTVDQPIKIIYTIKSKLGAEVGVEINNEINSFYIDYLKKKIYVKNPSNNFMLVYDYYINCVSLRGYLYSKDNRNVIDRSQLGSKDLNMYCFELKDNNKEYTINIFSLDSSIDRFDFVNKLLDYESNFDTIKDLFMFINCLINVRNYNIEITDNLNSRINVIQGQVDRFVEYQENEFGTKDKLYLKDGKFYIEKKIKEEYDDEVISYVKKLGVYNGKEKRES